MPFNVIDMFASCGGLSCGFVQAGFNVIAGIDNDPVALQTFAANHKHSKALQLDLYDKENFIGLYRHHDNSIVDGM